MHLLRGLVAVSLVSVLACASPERDPNRDEPGALEMSFDETSLEGVFQHQGRIVEFHARSHGNWAVLELDIDGTPLEVTLDLDAETLAEDAHGSTFGFEHRAILVALRDAVAEERPEVMETLHGTLLVKVADRFAEAPIGRALIRREFDFAPRPVPHEAVLSGCGGDGVTCLPGTSGSSWAIFFASGICDARSTPYGDSVCRGRCGAGCNWFDEDYTWDCLDHDVCLDYSNDCDDEWNEAADDWAATIAPLCWSGTSRSKPPSAPKCGDGVIGIGEECDDGDVAPDDGCSATCKNEPQPHLVINEIDYDNPGIDTAEFVEIFNPGVKPVSLDNLAVVFVNGSSSLEYARAVLSGTLPAGGYLVVCAPGSASGTCAAGINVPAGTTIINFALATNNAQNGSPDAVALIDLVAKNVVDAFSYEGQVLKGTVTDVGEISLSEGFLATVSDSGTLTDALCRLPNGADTNDAAADWARRPPSPGAPNL